MSRHVVVVNEVMEELRSRKKSCIIVKFDYEESYNLIGNTYYIMERFNLCTR